MISIRTPFAEDYVCLFGQALYVFAYYEWTIVYIINGMEPGFVDKYSRPKGNRPLPQVRYTTDSSKRFRASTDYRNRTRMPFVRVRATFVD